MQQTNCSLPLIFIEFKFKISEHISIVARFVQKKYGSHHVVSVMEQKANSESRGLGKTIATIRVAADNVHFASCWNGASNELALLLDY
jgi:hypothetical protein